MPLLLIYICFLLKDGGTIATSHVEYGTTKVSKEVEVLGLMWAGSLSCLMELLLHASCALLLIQLWVVIFCLYMNSYTKYMKMVYNLINKICNTIFHYFVTLTKVAEILTCFLQLWQIVCIIWFRLRHLYMIL